MIAEKLRKSILQAAIECKLTEQLPENGDARDLVEIIKKEKEELIKAGKIKKEKTLLEITEEEIPFDIPDNWCWVRLGDISSTITYSPKNINSEGTIVLRSSNIQDNKLNFDDIVRGNMDIPPNKKAKENDILICVRNGSKRLVGKAALIDGDEYSFGAFMSIIRTPLYRYIYNYILSPYFRQDFDSVSTTTSNQITQSNLKSRLVPLPPVDEQIRISEKVNNILPRLSALEEKEVLLNRIETEFPNKLNISILQLAMQGKLTEQLPEDGDAHDLLEKIKY